MLPHRKFGENEMSEPYQAETAQVAGLVDCWVSDEFRDAERFHNRTLLDESGVHALHRLATKIYTLGHHDGEAVAELRRSSREIRKREAAERE
jgi:hypothetical protein